jgi:hypothetical protein
MNKLETLKCIEITSQRQADNGTICYFDPQTSVYYMLYENGYVRRSFGRKKLWNGRWSDECIYQLNPTTSRNRVHVFENGHTSSWTERTRIMLDTHDKRVDCAARAIVSYRNTVKQRNATRQLAYA